LGDEEEEAAVVEPDLRLWELVWVFGGTRLLVEVVTAGGASDRDVLIESEGVVLSDGPGAQGERRDMWVAGGLTGDGEMAE